MDLPPRGACCGEVSAVVRVPALGAEPGTAPGLCLPLEGPGLLLPPGETKTNIGRARRSPCPGRENKRTGSRE